MLSKEKRVNLKKEFKWVASGKSVDSKFAKFFLRVGDNEYPRVGIATSSKTFKSAVLRNRARRILSSALESLYGNLTPKNLNIVALPKLAILDVKSGDVLLALEETFERIKVIDETSSN